MDKAGPLDSVKRNHEQKVLTDVRRGKIIKSNIE